MDTTAIHQYFETTHIISTLWEILTLSFASLACWVTSRSRWRTSLSSLHANKNKTAKKAENSGDERKWTLKAQPGRSNPSRTNYWHFFFPLSSYTASISIFDLRWTSWTTVKWASYSVFLSFINLRNILLLYVPWELFNGSFEAVQLSC